MRRMRWIFVGMCLLATLIHVAPSDAREDGLGGVLSDGFYGGLIGALVGTAVMAITEDPGDHLGYIATGAAIGVIGGTVYGVSQINRYAAVEVDGGRVVWKIPTPMTRVRSDERGGADVAITVPVFQLSFR